MNRFGSAVADIDIASAVARARTPQEEEMASEPICRPVILSSVSDGKFIIAMTIDSDAVQPALAICLLLLENDASVVGPGRASHRVPVVHQRAQWVTRHTDDVETNAAG